MARPVAACTTILLLVAALHCAQAQRGLLQEQDDLDELGPDPLLPAKAAKPDVDEVGAASYDLISKLRQVSKCTGSAVTVTGTRLILLTQVLPMAKCNVCSVWQVDPVAQTHAMPLPGPQEEEAAEQSTASAEDEEEADTLAASRASSSASQSVAKSGADAASTSGSGMPRSSDTASAASAQPQGSSSGAPTTTTGSGGSASSSGGGAAVATSKPEAKPAADDGTPAPIQKFKIYNEQWLEQAEGIAEDFVSTPAMERLKSGSFGEREELVFPEETPVFGLVLGSTLHKLHRCLSSVLAWQHRPHPCTVFASGVFRVGAATCILRRAAESTHALCASRSGGLESAGH